MNEPIHLNISLKDKRRQESGCCSIVTLLLLIAGIIACISAMGGQ